MEVEGIFVAMDSNPQPLAWKSGALMSDLTDIVDQPLYPTTWSHDVFSHFNNGHELMIPQQELHSKENIMYFVLNTENVWTIPLLE